MGNITDEPPTRDEMDERLSKVEREIARRFSLVKPIRIGLAVAGVGILAYLVYQLVQTYPTRPGDIGSQIVTILVQGAFWAWMTWRIPKQYHDSTIEHANHLALARQAQAWRNAPPTPQEIENAVEESLPDEGTNRRDTLLHQALDMVISKTLTRREGYAWLVRARTAKLVDDRKLSPEQAQAVIAEQIANKTGFDTFTREVRRKGGGRTVGGQGRTDQVSACGGGGHLICPPCFFARRPYSERRRPNMSVYLKLHPNDFADLLQLAARECRDVRAQATYMILNELKKQNKTPSERLLSTAGATDGAISKTLEGLNDAKSTPVAG